MKRIVLSFITAITMIVISTVYINKNEEEQEPDTEVFHPVLISAAPESGENEEIKQDESTTTKENNIIHVNIDGTLHDMDAEEYIVCVVAGEVSPTYEPEALKAQAVAARTYLYYKMNGGGCANGGDICTDYAHCQAYKSNEKMKEQWGEKYEAYFKAISDAVSSTENEIIIYENKPICALYHSSSVGKTEDCVSVFGGNRPYLVSVDSPLETTDSEYTKSVTFTKEEFTDKMNTLFGANIESIDIKIISHTSAGRVSTLKIGEKSVKATSLRTALGLRSTDFTFENNGDSITFTMLGYGHGVGMSQHGAQAMAQNGSDYKEILTHYYTGTSVEKADLSKNT